jgi:CheY-like chemotaxis protein
MKMATEEFIIRFRREIQAAARLNHPHVIAAFDAGECELGDFLVMEFVEGADFKEIVAESGPLSVDEALETVRQAAAGLSYAHQNGIVHRDIKPANLMRDVGGVVKVADLGLARMTDTADGVVESAGLTQTGAVSGTIDYMSPEQAIDSASVDHRADVYSLGCTLYFLLTGEPIFTASSLMGRMLAHRETPPPNLVDEIQGATQELDDLFHDMVQKNPKDRLNSMQDVIDRVESLQGKQSSGKVEQPKWNAEDCAVMLVVESRLQTSMISKMLNETAIQEVHACTSGEEALNRLRVTPVQAVIVSSTLPDMSGVQLCEQIRDELRWSRVAVLMMTSDPLKDGARRTIGRLTGVDVLQKPFDGTKLGNALRQLLTMEVEDHRQLAGLESRRILIVDDSSVARRRVAATLTELGFDDFVENENGADAIQRMRNEEFDLVVTDYNMPIVDGRDLIDWIRNESDQPDIPVIMVTTEFDPLKLAEIYQLGVSAICGKAFEREQVRNIIIRLFM